VYVPGCLLIRLLLTRPIVHAGLREQVAFVGPFLIAPKFAYPHPRYWALTAVYAYHAYNDSSMLVIAEGQWDGLSQYQPKEDAAAQGLNPFKTITFSGFCDSREQCPSSSWMFSSYMFIGSLKGGLLFVSLAMVPI
jgi:hypothetical protein